MNNLRKRIVNLRAVGIFLASFGLIVSLVFASFAPPAKAADGLNPPSWVAISVDSNLREAFVKWAPPSNLADSFEYKVQLLNNFGSLWEEKLSSEDTFKNGCVPFDDTKTGCTFFVVPAGFYSARVYAEKDGQQSLPAESGYENDGHITFSPENPIPFSDIGLLKDDEKNSLNWASSYRIARGAGGDFKPGDVVKRKEMASFLYRAFGEPYIPVDIKEKFLDYDKFGVHRGAIDWLASKGILEGYICTGKGVPNSICQSAGQYYFLPDGETSRGQMAQFLYKLAKTPEMSNEEVKKYLDSLNDRYEIPSDQERPIAWLVKESITTGYEDKTFRPKNRVSRIQMTQFLKRLAARLGTTPYLKEEQTTPSNFLYTGKLRSEITKITFIDTRPECINRMDVSEEHFSNAIYACVDGDEIVIGAYGGVVGNIKNSNFLFWNLSYNAGVTLNLKNFNAAKVKQMNMMFNGSRLNSLILSKDFGAGAVVMKETFLNASLQTNIDWSDTDFVIKTDAGGSIPDVKGMFENINWDKHCIYVKNTYYQDFFIKGTDATNINILVPGETCKSE
ncbi:MAG: S-layer homology domain-containing protein [Bifidobacteriaceae bacterium]|nr:S-layer homology domain-containing protein [Bifidobacteriaceae bacterium]